MFIALYVGLFYCLILTEGVRRLCRPSLAFGTQKCEEYTPQVLLAPSA